MRNNKNPIPYQFYAYRNHDMDKCPTCGTLPRDYYVQGTYFVPVDHVLFECAFGHQWDSPPYELPEWYTNRGEENE